MTTTSISAAEKAKQALAKSKKSGTLSGLKHNDIQSVIESMKTQIAQALPKHLSADRMIQIAANLITKNPKIAECSAGSLMGALMEAAILGFKPSNSLGFCYLVPYAGHVQFQIGYRGYIDLAMRSGQIKTIYGHVVREGDSFSYQYGLDRKLQHTPISGTSSKITHSYAVVHYKDGGFNFRVLTFDEIERLRMRSPMQKGAASGPWKTDYEAMAIAKAVKQLAKWMPLSDEMQNAVSADEGIIEPSSFENDRTGNLILDGGVKYAEDAESEDVTNKTNGNDADTN